MNSYVRSQSFFKFVQALPPPDSTVIFVKLMYIIFYQAELGKRKFICEYSLGILQGSISETLLRLQHFGIFILANEKRSIEHPYEFFVCLINNIFVLGFHD